MESMKKALLGVGSVALVAALSVAGTIAYLTSQDEDVNVMTLGNVKIEQIEQQWNDDKSDLELFEQLKPLYPYVGELIFENTDVEDGAYRRYGMNNVVDKYVSVKNTGLSDAYVRTVFAFEMGDDEQEYNNVKTSLNMVDGQDYAYADAWQWTEDFTTEIDGKKYNIKVAVHKAEVKSNETTIPSLLQVYLDKAATNETVESIDADGNGTYDIFVVSQAVQTKGFDNAIDALNEAFGAVTETNHPWVDGAVAPVTVDSPAALKTALKNGNDVIVTDDIILDEALEVTEEVSIELNNHVLYSAGLNFKAPVNIENGIIKSVENTSLKPHVKVSSGTSTFDQVTIEVDHYLNYQSSGNRAYAEYTGIEVDNAKLVMNNCHLKVTNDTVRTWNYVYGIILPNNAEVEMNGGSITIESAGGTIDDMNVAVSGITNATATLNDVQISAKHVGLTMGQLTLNTTDADVSDADMLSLANGKYTINYIK